MVWYSKSKFNNNFFMLTEEFKYRDDGNLLVNFPESI